MINQDLKIFGWNKKPKTLGRYLKSGDYFSFKLGKNLYGFGRILAKNHIGFTSIFFNYFDSEPDKFEFDNSNHQKKLFITILDGYSCFQSKHWDTDWRIIAQTKQFDDPYKSQITSIKSTMGKDSNSPTIFLGHNPDFSLEKEITEEEAYELISKDRGLPEYIHFHDHILDLLVHYRPDIFRSEHQPFILEDYLYKVFLQQKKTPLFSPMKSK